MATPVETEISTNIDEHFQGWERVVRSALARIDHDSTETTYASHTFSEVVYELESCSLAASPSRLQYDFVVLAGSHNLGKTTLRKYLNDRHGFNNFVHYTTRPIRECERDGIDQHFVTNEELFALARTGVVERMSKQGTGAGYYTAVDTRSLHRLISTGNKFVMERQLTTWQAMKQVLPADLQDRANKNCLTVFLLPPSLAIYKSRITARAEKSRMPHIVSNELERSLSKHYLVSQAAETPNVIFLVADDISRSARVIDQLVSRSAVIAS